MRPLTLAIARWLTTPEAQHALEGLKDVSLADIHLLALVTTLRKQYTSAQAAALIDQARLRRRGSEKFGALAQRMLFIDEALQQASGRVIASYRAGRYERVERVADLGCGIGGDALALSQSCGGVLGVELDPVRALLAEYNLGMGGGRAEVEIVAADWTTYEHFGGVEAAFADPARRVKGRRVFSLHKIVPPLSVLLALQSRISHLGVKVMPGVSDKELPAGCAVEWITEGRTCKEAVLWFGDLRPGAQRTATILNEDAAGNIMTYQLTNQTPVPPLSVTPPRGFLWEPDPSVIRASLVDVLAYQLGASQLDSQIAYLTTDESHTTPFARGWRVIEEGPFNLKALNRRLKKLGAYVVAVKKRGSPIEPERFRRRLKSVPNGRAVIVFVTRYRDQPWMVICENLDDRES